MNEEWTETRLGNYISIKSGLAYKGEKIGSGNSILLGMGCVSFDKTFVDSGARPYDDDSIDDRFCVVPGDIVLATRQQSENLPILAMPAVIPEYLHGKKVIFGTNLYKVDNKSEISNRFLFWLLKNNHYVSYIAGVKSGTAVQMVTKSNVERYKFLCPPQNEREKIADILWTYENLIQKNNKRIQILDQLSENLYKEWFIRFRFPGHEKAIFEGGVPKTWKAERLDKVFEVKYGKDHKSIGEGNIPIWGSGGIMRYGDRALYSGESVLIPRKGSLNNIIFTNGDFWTVDTMFYTKLLIENIGHYAYFTLKNMDMSTYNSGSALPSMTTDVLYHLRILIPDSIVLKRFEEIICLFDSQRKRLENENKCLSKQRDLLLPRLMSGKLQV